MHEIKPADSKQHSNCFSFEHTGTLLTLGPTLCQASCDFGIQNLEFPILKFRLRTSELEFQA